MSRRKSQVTVTSPTNIPSANICARDMCGLLPFTLTELYTRKQTRNHGKTLVDQGLSSIS